MSGSNFVDYVKINCRSGNGGKGSTHLRREKYIPKGGPDGGDGGRGGNVILRGNGQLWTLLHLRYTRHVKAGHGENGSKQCSSGSDGSDVYIEVPPGTIARDAETGLQECEILEDGQTAILMKGGRGGQGNWHFRSATNQTPRYAQSGEPGEEKWKVLELKILADIGLVGLPNAGKSTLLSVVTAAKPKIADYPFTTIVPNLGIVHYRDDLSFAMADIPGIIEGAHEGKGIGLRFLRHIERNAALLFMIPVDSEDIKKEYSVLLHELEEFNPDLLDKKRLLAITKCDLLDEEMLEQLSNELSDLQFIFISAISGKGIVELKDSIWKLLNERDDV